ncbi:MAG TPA: alpha/beta hydrolase, partial [Myxococcaceae bacterium]|nr:alpha/beta hydrolase [Myxococcaceae bacterium]
MSATKRNNVKVLGNGDKAMVFAHGYGCDQNMWRLITPAFRDEYKLVLFDHVGAGQSDASAYSRVKYSSLKGYAADVLDICRELELTKAVFVGHSVSAMIGVLAATREPARFAGLVLLTPSPRYVDDGDYRG